MSAAGVTIRTCPDGRSVFQWLYEGAPDACVTGNKPNTPTVKVTNGPATDYGNSPSGPTPDVVYPVVSPNGDDSATPPGADGTATTGRRGGCCPDDEANCWKCWVRDHWQWLLILALGLAAYLTRKK